MRKPADAERYRVERQAQSARNSAIFEAEAEKAKRAALAEAEQIEGWAPGRGAVGPARGVAFAVEREGAAEAAAILARGSAEAQSREQNALAFRQYGEAAIREMIAKVLPEVVRAAAEPISGVDRRTVISTDGASQLTRNVATNVEQGLAIGADLTGLDLRSLFRRLGSGGEAVSEPPEPERP